MAELTKEQVAVHRRDAEEVVRIQPTDTPMACSRGWAKIVVSICDTCDSLRLRAEEAERRCNEVCALHGADHAARERLEREVDAAKLAAGKVRGILAAVLAAPVIVPMHFAGSGETKPVKMKVRLVLRDDLRNEADAEAALKEGSDG